MKLLCWLKVRSKSAKRKLVLQFCVSVFYSKVIFAFARFANYLVNYILNEVKIHFSLFSLSSNATGVAETLLSIFSKSDYSIIILCFLSHFSKHVLTRLNGRMSEEWKVVSNQ